MTQEQRCNFLYVAEYSVICLLYSGIHLCVYVDEKENAKRFLQTTWPDLRRVHSILDEWRTETMEKYIKILNSLSEHCVYAFCFTWFCFQIFSKIAVSEMWRVCFAVYFSCWSDHFLVLLKWHCGHWKDWEEEFGEMNFGEMNGHPDLYHLMDTENDWRSRMQTHEDLWESDSGQWSILFAPSYFPK